MLYLFGFYRGISDDQYLLRGVQIIDQSATSINFDNSMSSEFEFDELLSLLPLTVWNPVSNHNS